MYTQDEIVKYIPFGHIIYDEGGTKICKLNDTATIVKYGPTVTELEAMNMEYVRQHTTILVPRVFLYFTLSDIVYIVMEYIQGVMLEDCLRLKSHEEVQRIATTIQTYIQELRSLRQDTIGPLDNTSKCIGPCFSYYGKEIIQCKQYTQFIDWLNSKIDIYMKLYNTSITDRFTTSPPIVFTHQDLNLRNMILTPNNTLYIIDWAYSGFYPTYFEYFALAQYKYQTLLWDILLSKCNLYPTEYKLLSVVVPLIKRYPLI
jgi:thiamine kinase-like enzyme